MIATALLIVAAGLSIYGVIAWLEYLVGGSKGAK